MGATETVHSRRELQQRLRASESITIFRSFLSEGRLVLLVFMLLILSRIITYSVPS